MRNHDNVEYEFGHEFTTDQLAAIVPNDLVRYFKKRAYDNPEANTDIEKPQIRADSARYWKKCISHFMPNQHMQWNEMANVGNPTKSPSLNKLISEIRRKETGRRGAPSKKRRALLKSEFEQAMIILQRWTKRKKDYLLGHTSVFNYTWRHEGMIRQKPALLI